MWKQIKLIPPPQDTQILFGYYDSFHNKVTRMEDGLYKHPVMSCLWANVWMEAPTRFYPGHLNGS